MGLRLRYRDGPAAGEEIIVDDELVLGRDQPAPGDLRGDTQLSRRHARLFTDTTGQARVEDLDSTNGTWLNGKRISKRVVLQTGDLLQIGRTTFSVQGTSSDVSDAQTEAATTADSTVVRETAVEPTLLIIAGPNQGNEITVHSELLIGRGYGEPGALGGDRLLSRRHARIARGPGGVFFLEDIGSSNGTVLNNARVRRSHALKDGDEIALGSCRLEARGFPRVLLAPDLDTAPREPHFGPRGGAQAAPPSAGTPPGPLGTAPAVAEPFPDPFVPQGAVPSRLSSRRVVAVFAGLLAAAAIVAVAVVLLAAPPGIRRCPSGFVCGKPPTAPPLRALTTFNGALGWRFEYAHRMWNVPADGIGGNKIELDEPSILVRVHAWRSTSQTAQTAMQTLATSVESGLVGPTTAVSPANQVFQRPVLGLHPATGEVIEGLQRPTYQSVKLVVLAATSGRVTIAAAVEYAIQRHELLNHELDQTGDQIIETVRFPSDGRL